MTRPADLAERMGETAETLAATDAERREAARRDVEALITETALLGYIDPAAVDRLCQLHTREAIDFALATPMRGGALRGLSIGLTRSAVALWWTVRR